MSWKNNGGQVYPGFPITEDGRQTLSEGITRRDWLAGLAMQGILSSFASVNIATIWLRAADEKCKTLPFTVAEEAYEFADAMIAEGTRRTDHEL